MKSLKYPLSWVCILFAMFVIIILLSVFLPLGGSFEDLSFFFGRGMRYVLPFISVWTFSEGVIFFLRKDKRKVRMVFDIIIGILLILATIYTWFLA